ncbi:hypothetical protein A9Z42_0019300 [Trichoderma parareesei]|uniref:Uncharacterized protein n=1 Tax=Trichoderma parareesei TaxID=858221 RepID=A0A2H2ZLL4_TRIPA|nr:hypothetical protein A9Z42_0019300 [Trichoderma parareesei]
MSSCRIRNIQTAAFPLSERRCRLVGGLERIPVRRNDGPGADDPKLSGRQPRVEGCEMRLMYVEMHVGSGRGLLARTGVSLCWYSKMMKEFG